MKKLFKTIICAMLTALLLTTSVIPIAFAVDKSSDVVTPAYKEQIFKDVEPTDWYFDAANIICIHGVMTGTAANKFSGKFDMSRAMVVQILYKLSLVNDDLYIPVDEEYDDQTFIDVEPTDWYYNATEWCYEHNIVTGTDRWHFTPNAIVTREQFALMLYNFTGFEARNQNTNNVLSTYADRSTVSKWAKDAVEWAVYNGFITGTTTKKGLIIDSAGHLTRAMVAQILYKFFDRYNLHSDEVVSISDKGIITYKCYICGRERSLLQLD